MLLQSLQSYTPADEGQLRFKNQILEFMQANPNCFERSNLGGHITGSCWLLNKAGDKALLMHHKKLDRWFQLGGHADGDSDIQRVALKEAQEESGIEGIRLVTGDIFDLDVHEIPDNGREPAHLHYDIRYLLQVTSDEDVIQNGESKELRWIGKNAKDLPTTSPSVTRMFDKWVGLERSCINPVL